MSHANISIFVPHLGCPNRCSFCQQNFITGSMRQPTAADIDIAVRNAVKSPNYDAKSTEIAFFGGSFTAIDKNYMIELLSTAKRYIDNGVVNGIRISTRPDCINDEILNILKQYGVTAIELGAQSMCDDVLKANLRGHTAEDVNNASKLIKQSGFELGLQMMTGLYKSDRQLDINTAEDIIALNPDTVRIYPTITLKNTLLESLYQQGEYIPPSLDETVSLCVELIEKFESNNIKIIRLGLHSIENEFYVAGPWHPSFRELCDSERYLQKILSLINQKGEYVIHVSQKDVSKAIGQKHSNIKRLEEKGFKCKVVSDSSVKPLEVIAERMS